MRLSQFIRQNINPIVSEWVAFANTMTPAANAMTKLQLQNHIKQILAFIADDIESDQSGAEQIRKSHGNALAEEGTSAAESHGTIRHSDGFDIIQMVAEFRALRASIIKLWTKDKKALSDADLIDVTRFNESIDQSLAESVETFTKKADYSRDLLLGILGHDIRSPLGAITMATHLLARVGTLNEKQSLLATQIETSADRITNIVSDLLDLTRAKIGTGLTVHRKPMELRDLAEQVLAEIRLQHTDSIIELQVTGKTDGIWDNTRLGQVISNLLANAVQYGTPHQPIIFAIAGGDTQVKITVNNQGNPIPSKQLPALFESLTRGANSTARTDALPNLGLGLFITKEIVKSHNGTITVTSNTTDGTTFTINLPRAG